VNSDVNQIISDLGHRICPLYNGSYSLRGGSWFCCQRQHCKEVLVYCLSLVLRKSHIMRWLILPL